MKATASNQAERFADIPNIGPAIAADLTRLGLRHPRDLRGEDAYRLYELLNRVSGKRQDPCVLDTFMSAVDFMNGAASARWWHYTRKRKLLYPDI
jgi:hypothetical protein